MAAYFLMNREQPRMQRIIRRRDKNPLLLPDIEFMKEYRMPPPMIHNICDLVKNEMSPRGYRKVNLTLEEKGSFSYKNTGLGQLSK